MTMQYCDHLFIQLFIALDLAFAALAIALDTWELYIELHPYPNVVSEPLVKALLITHLIVSCAQSLAFWSLYVSATERTLDSYRRYLRLSTFLLVAEFVIFFAYVHAVWHLFSYNATIFVMCCISSLVCKSILYWPLLRFYEMLTKMSESTRPRNLGLYSCQLILSNPY